MAEFRHAVSGVVTDIVAVLCEEPDMALGLEFLLARCVDLVDIDEAAMMILGEAESGPIPVASTGEPVRLLQEWTRKYTDGPANETVASGLRIDCADLHAETRWPRFGPVARSLGFVCLYTLPMRLHGQSIGVLTLAGRHPDALTEHDLDAAQLLADVGSLGVSGYQNRRSELRAAQLQNALNSRVVIEQAKGLIAERLNVSVDTAFELLRAQARNTSTKLHEVAASVVATRTSTKA